MALQATLLHNPKASQGRWSAETLLSALRQGGYEASYHSTKRKGWQKAVEQAEGLLVIAGGDGTVAKVCKLPVSRRHRIAILPTGGANNIAASLGIVGRPDELARRLKAFEPRAFRIGMLAGLAELDSFVEAVGIGALAATAGMVDNDMSADRKREEGRAAFRSTLRNAEPITCELLLDGVSWHEKALFLEIMIISCIGPGLPLAPGHVSGTDRFAVAWLAPEDRDAMIEWLRSSGNRHSPLRQTSAKRVDLSTCQMLRVDDEIMQEGGDVVLSLDGRQVELLVPATEKPVNRIGT